MELIDEASYQLWAEKKFFKMLENITDDDFTTRKPGFTKSLKEIYNHKYEVMWFWLTLLQVKDSKKINKGENPLGTPDFEPLSKKEFITESIKLFESMIEFIKNNQNTKVTLKVEWLPKPYTVTIQEVIYNILNHLTYHRGQTAFLFKKYGFEIPATDYNPYMYEINQLS